MRRINSNGSEQSPLYGSSAADYIIGRGIIYWGKTYGQKVSDVFNGDALCFGYADTFGSRRFTEYR